MEIYTQEHKYNLYLKGKTFDYDIGWKIWGLFTHLVLLLGILDANFHSPIIENLPEIPVTEKGPSKRILLFVADGLRFRTFLENVPLYLSEIIENNGVWGISHTKMPTESRPGNIAIVAGLYEDPSALFKGWKENPVEFDSVFNQSYRTWGWGSPDIISLFLKGKKRNFIGKSYPSSWQDFDPSSPTIRLDSWVFNRFLEWLEQEAHTVKNEDRIILFLHLLGCDTAGHASKPHSKDYVDNIKYLDKRIQEVVQKTEQYFEPGSTTYLFTSDHGMTDWGSHGSGTEDETQTPFISWGAGVANNSDLQNIDQADITPFISTLLGIPVPVNNEGILKLQLLSNEHKEYGARALLRNIKQLALQVKANRELSLGSNKIKTHWRESKLHDSIQNIETLLLEGKVSECIVEGEKTILLAKEFLLYFRQYQRNRFILYLTAMWLGWIVLLYLKINGKHKQEDRPLKIKIVQLSLLFAFFLLLVEYAVSGYQDLRILGYGIMAIVSVWLSIRQIINLSDIFKIESTKLLPTGFIMIMILIFTIFAGLINRIAFTFAMVYATIIQKMLLKGSNLWLLWTGISLAIFPSLPVVQSEPQFIVVLTSLCLTGSISLKRKSLKRLKFIECLRLVLTGLVYVEYLDGRSWISWTILYSTPFCIWLYPSEFHERIVGVTIHLLCPFVLLSTSYEPFFFLMLSLHFRYWPISNELKDSKRNTLHMNVEDLLKAASLILYTLLCFFGTGNMASISSFDPRWTRHFITIFSPFTMMLLILLKTVIPLVLVGCASRAFASSSVFLGVLFLGDCLTLPFMYGVTNQGSWLDIGSAISRFIIVLTLPCFQLLMYYLSYTFMTMRFTWFLRNSFKKAQQSV